MNNVNCFQIFHKTTLMKSGDGRSTGPPQNIGKLVTTERPFTPKPRERHLYGQDYTSASSRSTMRPSSSIQLQLIEEECGSMSPVSSKYDF